MNKFKNYLVAVLSLTLIAFLVSLYFQSLADLIIKYDRVILSVAVFILIVSLFFQRKQNELYQALKEKQGHIDRDLTMARDIQQAILNHKLPQHKGIMLNALCRPAREIGGDFYGAIKKNHLLHFYIGDVTGHGIASALLMSMANSLIEEISKSIDSPAKIVSELNHTLCQQLPNNNINFVTLFYACLNTKTKKLTYCSAGHHPGLIFRARQKPLKINTPNTFVGMFKENYYQEKRFQLKSKDKLLIYTDGILEGRHQKTKQELGEEFILDFFKTEKASGKKALSGLLNSVLANISEQKDDISLVLLEL